MVVVPAALTVPAVALKVADVAPAATVTDAGTVTAELLLDKATADPPDGAAPESVTVQVELPPDDRLAGEHCRLERVVVPACTAMAPPVALVISPLPLAELATADNEIGTLPLLDALNVNVAVATVPLPIVLSFKPLAMHKIWPADELHWTVFPAAVNADAAATLTEVTEADGYVMVHSRPAGAPLPAENVIGRATEPPDTAVPEASARDAF